MRVPTSSPPPSTASVLTSHPKLLPSKQKGWTNVGKQTKGVTVCVGSTTSSASDDADSSIWLRVRRGQDRRAGNGERRVVEGRERVSSARSSIESDGDR